MILSYGPQNSIERGMTATSGGVFISQDCLFVYFEMNQDTDWTGTTQGRPFSHVSKKWVEFQHRYQAEIKFVPGVPTKEEVENSMARRSYSEPAGSIGGGLCTRPMARDNP